MKLYQKLLLGFACVALLVSCVGFVAQQMNARIERSIEQWQAVALQELVSAGDLQAAYRESLEANQRRAAGPDVRPDADSVYQRSVVRFESAMSTARSAVSAGRARAAELDQRDRIARQNQKLIWLAEAADAFAAQHPAADALPTEAQIEAVEGPLHRFREASRAAFDTEALAVRAELGRADRLLFGAVLLGIGMTLVLGILISHSIAAPIFTLTEAARTLGEGRLDHRVRLSGPEEVGALGDALNSMADRLDRTTVSRADVEAILRSMTDPLLLTDLSGQVTMANAAALLTLGYEPEEVVGASIGKVLGEGEDAAQRIVERTLRWGTSGNLDASLRTREGAELPVAFSAALMRGLDGRVRGIVCVAKDITEQKRVEHELIQARRRAEEMARMKSSFLANMSHEIRTPLTGIIGSAQVLADLAEGEALEVAGIVERAGVRLLSTINSILDMARLEAGEFHPTSEVLPLATEARDAVSVLQPLAEGRSLSLEILERRADVHVVADGGFLHRIVTNLVGNAIKFTEFGGVTVEIDAEGDETAVLRVSDTGIGINPSFLPHLFEEFRQESSGLHRRHEGTGLGLAITLRLVELLGGAIEVESEVGHGTTFTVRLPRAAAQPEGAPRFEPALAGHPA